MTDIIHLKDQMDRMNAQLIAHQVKIAALEASMSNVQRTLVETGRPAKPECEHEWFAHQCNVCGLIDESKTMYSHEPAKPLISQWRKDEIEDIKQRNIDRFNKPAEPDNIGTAEVVYGTREWAMAQTENVTHEKWTSDEWVNWYRHSSNDGPGMFHVGWCEVAPQYDTGWSLYEPAEPSLVE